MENKDQQNRQVSGGSGSAENTGRDRTAQQTDIAATERNANNDSIEGSVPMGSIRDTGALSGRDDASGGSGDGMENTSSNEATERL